MLPFVIGSPITLFWTVLCIILPIFKKDFYSQFSFIPIALYDVSFYDGLGYDPNNTSIHPFAKRFVNENSVFKNTFLVLIIMVIGASKFRSRKVTNSLQYSLSVAQFIFWIYSTSFYYKLRSEEKVMEKQAASSSKNL